MTWRMSFAPQYKHEHEAYLDRHVDAGLSIAGMQRHVFECIMEERTSIL